MSLTQKPYRPCQSKPDITKFDTCDQPSDYEIVCEDCGRFDTCRAHAVRDYRAHQVLHGPSVQLRMWAKQQVTRWVTESVDPNAVPQGCGGST